MNINIETLNDFLAQDDLNTEVKILDLYPSSEIKCIDCGDLLDKIASATKHGDIPKHASKYWCETCLEEKIL
jgi:hypothetical protein|tara:strand:+ start:15 stop:230 length:216 start_codon:yes stop_codon:yes gene_type:complete